MANVKKYSARSVGHLIAHFERRQMLNKETGKMEYVWFGNRDIDTRWTPLNYRVWPPLPFEDTDVRNIFVSQGLQDLFDGTGYDPEESALARFRRIFRETPHAKRKDLACFCCWAISLPNEIPTYRMGEFFDLCMRYCVSKYGAENIVGGWVHVDEDHRPHLHVAFVPVATTVSTDDDGNELINRRICAKEVINRKHLSSWHGGLTSLIQQKMKIENPGIENGITREQGGNRTVEQMKAADKHYEKTKGKEVNEWRRLQEIVIKDSVEAHKTKTLDNMLVSASERAGAQLQQPRKRTLGEMITGR